MKIIISLLLLLISLQLFSKNNSAKDIKKSIETNYYSFDIKKHEQNYNLCTDYIQNNSNDWKGYYYRGFVSLILGKILYNQDEDKAYDYFNNSIDDLHIADSKKESAEIKLLLSDSYAKKASLSGLLAFYWGLKSKSWIFDSKDIDSVNRKVYLIGSIHYMHIPENYGGDKKKAEYYLNKALTLPLDDDEYFVQWGKDAEIYAYLAQLRILQNKPKLAKHYIYKAQQLEKYYGFIEKDLLKQLNLLKED